MVQMFLGGGAVVVAGVMEGVGGGGGEGGGAEWVGSACVADRSGGKTGLPHDLTSLLVAAFPLYDPEECPLCAAGLPLVKPGSRKGPGE